jgi:hypothetical protein
MNQIVPAPLQDDGENVMRYVAWYHELDAWTEYWDVYHPETRGRFFFGDHGSEQGLLTHFLPRERRPAPFIAWIRMATRCDVLSVKAFADEVLVPEVAAAVMEIDDLLARLFAKHFGNAADPCIQADYLEGIFRFATNTLPPAVERDARIPPDDPRKATAGRHMLDGDLMWFCWALQVEAAQIIAGTDNAHARRALFLAGVAVGCPFDFAWRGHRRTRSEYGRTAETVSLLRERGRRWATDFGAAAEEIHALYRIREYGHEGCS